MNGLSWLHFLPVANFFLENFKDERYGNHRSATISPRFTRDKLEAY